MSIHPMSLHLAVACIAGFLATLPATGQSGNLDPSFGPGGKFLTAIGSGDARGHGMALQSDGKLVVAGYSNNGSNNDFAVVRYNADGTLDTSFGGTGKVTTDFGGTDDIANGVAVQSDGKIIVVGRASSGGTSPGFALARYHPDGTPDTGFGIAGTGRTLTVIGFAHPETQAMNVKLQPDGKILVVGTAAPDGNLDFIVVRYLGDGMLDNGFGTGGMVSTLTVSGFGGVYAHNDYALDLALRGDGKILVGGHSTGPLESGYMITVYNNDGTPDAGFATGGKMYVPTYSDPAGMSQAYCVAWQADGKILVGGINGTGEGRNFCLRRFSDAGIADASFGNQGLVITPIGTAADVPYDLALQGDGKIVVVGSSYNADTGFDDFAVVRHQADGSLDTTFRSTGRVTTGFRGGNAVGRSVVIGPDGRIVVAGHAHNGTKNHFALARYFADGSLVLTSPAHLSHTNNSQPVIAGKASPGFTVNVHIDGSVVGSTMADGGGAWSLTVSPPLSDGVHTVAVSETDGLGNTGPLSTPVSFTVDTVAPVAPVITSPVEASLVHSSRPVVTGTAEPGAVVTIFIDETLAGSAFAGSLGNWSFTPSAALENGMHTVKATSTDRAGNTGVFSNSIGFSTLAALFGGPGNPDTSFGVAGKLLTPVGSGDDRGHGVALQSDGKLVVAGYSHNGSNNDFAVVRYNADGTLDTGFGGTGKVTTDFGGTNDIANGVALQSDGKILVVGSASTTSSWLFALARYHPDGVLDTSFGLAGTGRVTTAIGYPQAGTRAEGVTIQPDGKILVVGNAAPNGNADFVVLRYLGDGTLDNGFGTGGMVNTDNSGTHLFGDYALDLALRADGKILVGGYTIGPLNSGYMVTVYHNDGTPDIGFATGGKMYFSAEPAGMNQVYCVAWQADGKILVGGISGTGAGRNFCLRRFSEAGVADATFGNNGLVVTPIGTAADVPYDLAVQGDGKIVVIGSSFNANTGFDDFAVVRYHAIGSLDTTFRGTGRVTANFPNGNAVGRSVVIGPDGRIVVAGYAHDGSKDRFALARFFGTDQPPQVTTGGATGIVRDGAVLNGIVNPNNLATVAHFEYGLTTDYGNTTPEMDLGNGYLDVAASSVIGGLTDNTTYHFRLVSTNAAGTTYGEDAVFTTAPNPPLAFTGESANVSASGATLVGTVLPNGRDTTVYFEFGLSAAYGNQTTSQLVPATGTIENVFSPLTGLVPGATYHFRLVAVNAGSPIPITGADKTFVALAPAPVVELGAAVPLSSTSVGLSGSVNANDANTQVFFDYGTDGTNFPFSVAATPAVVSGTNPTAVTGAFMNLSQGVTYHYRLRAVSAGGTTTSDVATFTLDLLSGLTQVFPGAVPEAEGSLIVILNPPGILHGWRFIGEQQWRASGVAVGGLTTGDREIEFRPVAGFIHPPAESAVNVTSGGATTILTRDYFETSVTGSGGLNVTLKPESITSGEDRAQWRLLGEDDAQWRDSGATLTGLIAGSYLIECKPVAGRSTPPNANVVISAGQTAAPSLTYFLAATATGALPNVLAFESVSTDTTRPYAYVGQIRSNLGSGTGFAVKERVVATAAHVVWDEGTFSAAQGLQWHFQRHRGNHEPIPQAPRGFYVMAGYAAQRQTENSPGSFSPASRNLDVAALYFLSAAARGGHSGFLASDLDANEFLLSDANKMLVGYPIDGIPTGSQGRMHATTPGNVLFSPLGATANRTYLTTGIRSTGGASGGPLCVQFDAGNYYPAAIYLGGSEQTLVRTIDSAVIDLFNRAELSGIDDLPHVGGGITHSSFTATSSTSESGALKVNIEPPAARNAGAGWRLKPATTYNQSGSQKSNLRPGTYILELRTVDGFAPPAEQSVVIEAGQLREITFTYGTGNTALETWRFTHFGSTQNTGTAADTHDADGDGQDNLAEFTAGTDPKDADDRFHVVRTTMTGNQFSVVIPGKAGRDYTLQRAAALTGPWENVASSGMLAAQGEVTLGDPARLPERGFYRVITHATP